MSRNIVPRVNKGSNLGTEAKNWNKLFADAVILRGEDLRALLDGKTDLSTLTNKGDLYVATDAGVITRLPAGEDGYVLRANSIDSKGLDWVPVGARQELTGDITVTVGDTGDFPTINSALESVVALYYPKYISGDNCPRVTITLLPGFVMSEQVIVESLDLSWITITGVDDETIINRSALTYRVVRNNISLGGFNAFTAINGGFLPIIGQLFNMDQSGSSSERNGIVAYYNSRAIVAPGCGVKNAGYYGMYASNSSIIEAVNTTFSGAFRCVVVENNSLASVNGIDASGANQYGIYVAQNSLVNAANANVSGAVVHGFIVGQNSMVNATGADASGTGDYGFAAIHGSIINASNTIGSMFVNYGSIISAYNTTGGTNITVNTLTSQGIIFR